MGQIRAEMNQLWAIGGPRHQAKVERHPGRLQLNSVIRISQPVDSVVTRSAS